MPSSTVGNLQPLNSSGRSLLTGLIDALAYDAQASTWLQEYPQHTLSIWAAFQVAHARKKALRSRHRSQQSVYESWAACAKRAPIRISNDAFSTPTAALGTPAVNALFNAALPSYGTRIDRSSAMLHCIESFVKRPWCLIELLRHWRGRQA